ncbi:MAG: hypothetical protein LBI92_08710 [Azoarcus sp.]|jgi:pilus assembly protein FimV|nr:hypothetical protein [Azoarcus sp.]
MKPTIRASLIAAAIAMLPFGAQAAGLGPVNVLSRLGEPLNAEIPITATPQELQSLSARIAAPETFLQVSVPYAEFVPGVRVAIENRGARSVLKLTSSGPVNEAVASLIVQLNWDDGRLSRTYNLLLDPADLTISAPTPVAPAVTPPVVEPEPAPQAVALAPPPEPERAPMPESTPAPAQQAAAEPEPEPQRIAESDESAIPPLPVPEPEAVPAPAPAPEPQLAMPEPRELEPAPAPTPSFESAPSFEPAPAPRVQESEYTIKRGDKLGLIASANKDNDVTLDQMMIALHRANPGAFIDNNINRIKTGAVLKLPSADEVRSINSSEARREVRMQSRLFNEWRQQVAQAVAVSPASTGADEGAGSSRQIDTVPSRAEQTQDRVQVVTGPSAQEELIKFKHQLDEAQSRLKDLEGISSSQKAMNDVLQEQADRLKQERDLLQKENSQLQAKLNGEQPAGIPVPAPAPVVQEPVPAPAEGTVAEPLPTPEPAPAPEPVPEPVAAEPAPASEPASPPVIENEQDEEDPLLSKLTDPSTLGMGALIILLLGGFLAFRSYRSKHTDDIGLDTMSQDTSMFPSEATSIFGDNGGQSVDTSASSVIHTDFSQTGLSIDTNEGVDPVAEADVYMAYGRDTQAEEILNDALKADPKRGAIYVKLLEIYAQRQDLAQFETTATELFERTQGQGRDWDKAVQMGRKLDPANPLYSGNAPGANEEGTTLRPDDLARLDLGAAEGSAASGPTLSDLDFGTAPVAASGLPAAGQLKDTVAVRGKVDDLLATRIIGGGVTESAAPARAKSGSGAAGSDAGRVDFNLGSNKTVADAVAGSSIDFDLDLAASASPGTRPAGSATRAPASKAGGAQFAAAKGSDLAAPLEFDLPELGLSGTAKPNGRGLDATATVVLPSVEGGNEHSDDTTLDLEKTSFDPRALDFDLDLDAGGGAAVATAPVLNGAVSSADEAGEAGEIDTKLELARAYEDMGDTEGALELLREVVAEGNAAQKSTAQSLIDKLS